MGNVELFTDRIGDIKLNSDAGDALAGAKIALKFVVSLKDERVWGESLFVFYHIFAFLEDAKKRLDMPDYNKLYVHKTLYRKKAFEADLTHYFGRKWKSKPRPTAVKNYLHYLHKLEKETPHLLLTHVLFMYMFLLGGGLILDKYEEKTNHTHEYTNQVAHFADVDIRRLVDEVKSAMNEVAATMSPEQQQVLIDERNQVYIYNRLLINSIGGQDQVFDLWLYPKLFRWLLKAFIGLLVLFVSVLVLVFRR